MTLAQVEVGAKTNETTHFRLLLAPLDLIGTVVTFDAPGVKPVASASS